MSDKWEQCRCMSVVELAKLQQDNKDIEFRASHKGQYVELGWVGFFYKAVNDPQLFVTLFGVGDGALGKGDRAPVARVDKMIPCLLVEKRKKTNNRKQIISHWAIDTAFDQSEREQMQMLIGLQALQIVELQSTIADLRLRLCEATKPSSEHWLQRAYADVVYCAKNGEWPEGE